MPSPFPGMNPYLEHEDAWHNFHVMFPTAVITMLDPLVGPEYYLKADENVYVHDLPEDLRQLHGRPDVFLGETNGGPIGESRAAGPAVLTKPRTVLMPEVDLERVPYIEIRDRRNRRLVTIIELLSPSNKNPGADRDQYEAKRQRTLASHTNLVEIDLLRGGARMPMTGPADGDYGVLVSRYIKLPRADWFPIALREPLPTIPIPLNDDDPTVGLDLQSILHHIYDAGGFKKYMYQTQPAPPLTPEDAAWARGVLANAGITATPLTPSA